jgi:hypothetical protein
LQECFRDRRVPSRLRACSESCPVEVPVQNVLPSEEKLSRG